MNLKRSGRNTYFLIVRLKYAMLTAKFFNRLSLEKLNSSCWSHSDSILLDWKGGVVCVLFFFFSLLLLGDFWGVLFSL